MTYHRAYHPCGDSPRCSPRVVLRNPRGGLSVSVKVCLGAGRRRIEGQVRKTAPRARGDGPLQYVVDDLPGCSTYVSVPTAPRPRRDDPQAPYRWTWASARLPRSRGWLPEAGQIAEYGVLLPGVQGWSRALPRGARVHHLLPARAGMVPLRRRRVSRQRAAFRSRGDGPDDGSSIVCLSGCSPYVRGWPQVRGWFPAAPCMSPRGPVVLRVRGGGLFMVCLCWFRSLGSLLASLPVVEGWSCLPVAFSMVVGSCRRCHHRRLLGLTRGAGRVVRLFR